MRSFAALLGDVGDLLLRTIGKVAGVGVTRHDFGGGDKGFCGDILNRWICLKLI